MGSRIRPKTALGLDRTTVGECKSFKFEAKSMIENHGNEDLLDGILSQSYIRPIPIITQTLISEKI